METTVRYNVGEGFTAIDTDVESLLKGMPSAPVDICRVVQGLVTPAHLAEGFGIPVDRHEERSIRTVSDILRVLKKHDDRGLGQEREFPSRVVGTCRHFALLACAFLRYRDVPARCRAGFASYFTPGVFLDHWVVEYRDPLQQGWIRNRS